MLVIPGETAIKFLIRICLMALPHVPGDKFTLTDIYITVPSQESFPEISVSSVSKNDRVIWSLLRPQSQRILSIASVIYSLVDPRHEKTGFLHMRKQRRRLAAL